MKPSSTRQPSPQAWKPDPLRHDRMIDFPVRARGHYKRWLDAAQYSAHDVARSHGMRLVDVAVDGTRVLQRPRSRTCSPGPAHHARSSRQWDSIEQIVALFAARRLHDAPQVQQLKTPWHRCSTDLATITDQKLLDTIDPATMRSTYCSQLMEIDDGSRHCRIVSHSWGSRYTVDSHVFAKVCFPITRCG